MHLLIVTGVDFMLSKSFIFQSWNLKKCVKIFQIQNKTLLAMDKVIKRIGHIFKSVP